jgi:hypothetical protein
MLRGVARRQIVGAARRKAEIQVFLHFRCRWFAICPIFLLAGRVCLYPATEISEPRFKRKIAQRPNALHMSLRENFAVETDKL